LETIMTKELFALLAAGTLMVPLATSATGYETAGQRVEKDAGPSTLPLAPVPHLDTIPWLRSDFTPREKMVLPLGPKLDTLGPFLFPPIDASNKFSSSGNVRAISK
jgi:hypothetical protein